MARAQIAIQVSSVVAVTQMRRLVGCAPPGFINQKMALRPAFRVFQERTKPWRETLCVCRALEGGINPPLKPAAARIVSKDKPQKVKVKRIVLNVRRANT
jgi:hypothetical protein